MRRFLQIAAVGGAALLLVSLVLAPILVYELGIPWLPSLPRASDSQLGLFYAIDAPLIGGAGWLLSTVYKYLPRGWNSNFGTPMPKPQTRHSSHSQAQQTTYDDPLVIGGGRGWDWSCVLCVVFGLALLIPSVVGFLNNPIPTGNVGMIVIAIGIGGILSGLGLLYLGIFGYPKGCLKIGSEGINYYRSRADRLFIPWDEMSRVYITRLTSYSDYLYVELKDRSTLHFLEPIKSRYAKGAIAVCSVSDSSRSTIPKHLVEDALNIYTPYDVERSRK